jgi:hypothetical protein
VVFRVQLQRYGFGARWVYVPFIVFVCLGIGVHVGVICGVGSRFALSSLAILEIPGGGGGGLWSDESL